MVGGLDALRARVGFFPRLLRHTHRFCPGILIVLALVTAVGAQVTGPFLLEVQKLGTGQGTVSSSIPGIDCGSDCSEPYPAGTQVTLTATAPSGYFFAGWASACTGTTACTLTIDGAKRVSALFATDTSAQTWAQLYNAPGGGIDISSLLLIQGAGVLAVSKNHYSDQTHLLMLNQDGSLAAQAAFQSLSYYSAKAPPIPASNGYFLTGGVYSNGQLIKLNSAGGFVWRRGYALTANAADPFTGLATDGSGGAVVAVQGSVPWVMRVDSNGDPVWQKSFSTTGTWSIGDIKRVGDSGYLAAGTYLTGFRILRLTTDGQVLWARDYASATTYSNSYQLGNISVTEDGGCLLVGGLWNGEILAMRITASGEITWAKTFNLDFDSSGYGAILEDGFLVSGNSYLLGSKGYGWLARLDPDGNIVWQRVYGGPANLRISAIAPLPDGTVQIGGPGWAARLDEAGYLSSCPIVHEHSIPSTYVPFIATPAAPVPQSDSIFVSFRSISGLASTVTATPVCPGTIPVISAADLAITEPEEFNAWAQLTFRLSTASPLPITFSYQTAEDQAKASSDFVSASGSLTLQPGVTETKVTIVVLADSEEEPDEKFLVRVTQAGNAAIGTPATVTILDTDTYRSLSLVRQGTGSGLVKSSPQGIDCGTFCSAAFKRRSVVTLTATPDPGSVFVGFHGPNCPTGSSCNVNLDSSTVVTAEFRAEFSLSVVRTGTGGGVISSEDTKINCGTACLGAYVPGSAVTLNAVPDTGSSFAGWGGACTGTGPCQVTMTDFKSVTAHFNSPSPETYALAVTKTGSGSGKVRSPYPGIDCGPTCSQTYTKGSQVALVAWPDPGSIFTGWAGACSGTGNCAVAVSSDLTATANFDLSLCSSSLAPTQATVSSAGEQASVGVSSPAGCQWSAASFAPWIEIVSAQAGEGNGDVTYAVGPNSGPARTGTLLVAGIPFTVKQEGACASEISPVAASVGAGGETLSADICGPCPWLVRSEAPWISIQGPVGGIQAGTIQYVVRPNPTTEERVGRLSVGESVLTVTQEAASCPGALSSRHRSISALGGSFNVEVTMPAGCSWHADTSATWISLGSSTGSGDATLSYSIQPNPGGGPRVAEIKVNDQTLEITQVGLNTWFSSGPDGASPSSLAAHPSNPGVVYAAFRYWGVLKSTDGGLNWRPSDAGLAGRQFERVVVAQADPRLLWVTGLDGTYKSTDGGDNWTKINSNSYRCIASDPAAAGVVYFADTYLWKLANADNPVNIPGSPADPTALAIDPSDSSTLYLSNSAGIHKSTDGGGTWQQVFAPASSLTIYQLTVVPGNPPTVYAATGSGLLKSGDAGSTWQWLWQTLPSGNVGAFAYNTFSANEIYYSTERAVRRSFDAGQSWVELPDPPFNTQILVLGGKTYKTLIAGGDGVSVWSEDSGWTKSSTGTSRVSSTVTVHPFDSTVYAADSFDRLISRDHGTTWEKDNAAPVDTARLVFDPSNPLIRYHFGLGNLFYKSTDGGLTWVAMGQGFPSLISYSAVFEVDPSDPERLYTIRYGIHTSGDGGKSWGKTTEVEPGYGYYASCLLFRPSEPGVVYAGLRTTLFRSFDGGGSWAPMTTFYSSPDIGMKLLKNDPLDPNAIYASTTAYGLRRSTNFGASWTTVKNISPSHLEFDPLDPSRMWALAGQVFLSPDAGTSWYIFNQGAPWAGPVLTSLAVDRSDAKNLYAASYGGLLSMRTGTECAAQFDQSQAISAASGGNGSLQVTALPGCTWSVQSGAGWLTLTSPTSGSGNGVVSYQVAQNFGIARKGGLLIAGRHFPVHQQGLACTYSLTVSSASHDALGGSGLFSVTLSYAACPVPPAVSSQPWIKIDSQSGATVRYVVAMNLSTPGAPALPRSGTIKIGDLVFTINQGGAPFLTINKLGNGSGTVTSSPAGIDCGPDCSEPYEAVSEVTLTANPGPGSAFVAWQGGACSGTGTCKVTVDVSKTVTANFSLLSYPLTVSKSGPGSGVVLSYPAGIDCGTTCSASFPYGTLVTLTAGPEQGWKFAGWSGACQGPNDTCQLNITQAQAVTAEFVQGFDWDFDLSMEGYLGVGTDTPQRAIHLSGPNAVFRMDRSVDTAAFLLSRIDAQGNQLKTFVVGVDASGPNEGQFIIADMGTAVGGASLRRMTITNTGDVLFGGNLTASQFLTPSSFRFKDHIQLIQDPIRKVRQLSGVGFNWKQNGMRSLGVLAENVQAVLPQAVSVKNGSVAGVNYDGLVALLLQSSKSQVTQVEILRARKRELIRLLEQLRKGNDLLEKGVK